MSPVGGKWSVPAGGVAGFKEVVLLAPTDDLPADSGETWSVRAGEFFLEKLRLWDVVGGSPEQLASIPTPGLLLSRQLPEPEDSWAVEDVLALAEKMLDAAESAAAAGGKTGPEAARAARALRALQDSLLESGERDLSILGGLEAGALAAEVLAGPDRALVLAYGREPDPRTIALAPRNAVVRALAALDMPRPLIAAYLVHRGLLSGAPLERLVAETLKGIFADSRSLVFMVACLPRARHPPKTGGRLLGLPGDVTHRFRLTLHLRSALATRIVDLKAAVRPVAPATPRRAREGLEREVEMHRRFGALLPMVDLLLLTFQTARRWGVPDLRVAAQDARPRTYVSSIAAAGLAAAANMPAPVETPDIRLLRPYDHLSAVTADDDPNATLQEVRGWFRLPPEPGSVQVTKKLDLRPLMEVLPEEVVLSVALAGLSGIDADKPPPNQPEDQQ